MGRLPQERTQPEEQGEEKVGEGEAKAIEEAEKINETK